MRYSCAHPQVKVCGLTLVQEAIACAELGADAIGLVFYPASPRFVSDRWPGKYAQVFRSGSGK